jgi:hypothetical protein
VHDAQVTHLKEWTLLSWLRADLAERALPWARLVRAGRPLPRDLNFRPADRAASVLTVLAVLLVVLAPLAPVPLLSSALAAAAVALAVDRPLLAFFARRVGPFFAVRAAGLHLLHRLVGVAGFAVGWFSPRPRGPARSR